MKKLSLLLAGLSFICQLSLAQSGEPLGNRINLVFGVGQITQGGFNVEGNIFYRRLAFDYSHGVSLNTSNSQLEAGADRDQSLAVHLPWTTGFGVGYRFSEWLNLRVEPKWHKYELFYDGEAQTADNLIGDYITFTLGLGLYANLRPFKTQKNFLKGIAIVPNARWWPRVSSTLDSNQLQYNSQITGQTETHHTREIGIANTPFFINVSVGYSIQF
jgi:hypothetical protein